METITLSSLQVIDKIDPSNVYKAMKLNHMISFANAKMQNPHLKKKELCEKIKCSPSTVDRAVKDLSPGHSFYRTGMGSKKTKKKQRSDTNFTSTGVDSIPTETSSPSMQNNSNICTICNQSFKTPSALKTHNSKSHKQIGFGTASLKNIQQTGQGGGFSVNQKSSEDELLQQYAAEIAARV